MGLRRLRAVWKALRAWLERKRRRRRRTSLVAPAAPALEAEIKNPLRLNDEEYLRVMKELDEVLGDEEAENSSLYNKRWSQGPEQPAEEFPAQSIKSGSDPIHAQKNG